MDERETPVCYENRNYPSLRKLFLGEGWREKRIAEEYGGDAERFEADWQKSVEYGRRNAVHWDDLISGATILPDLEEAVHDLIERRLGYLPNPSVVLPYEPYLRALLKQRHAGQLDDALFAVQAEEHIKLIRNAEMTINLCADYEASIYRSYETHLPQFKDKVKARLTRFLGYEPQLKHSLVGELWLRDMLAKDLFHLPDDCTLADLKVMTLIKYREALLAHGQPAADALPLLGTGSAFS